MMDPLVDEYSKTESTKGTELAALKIAQEKAKSFTWKQFKFTLVFLAIDIIQKLRKRSNIASVLNLMKTEKTTRELRPKKLPKWYYFLLFPAMMVWGYIMRS
jgi:hypothetical protein